MLSWCVLGSVTIAQIIVSLPYPTFRSTPGPWLYTTPTSAGAATAVGQEDDRSGADDASFNHRSLRHQVTFPALGEEAQGYGGTDPSLIAEWATVFPPPVGARHAGP
jgi:hypothetical protein